MIYRKFAPLFAATAILTGLALLHFDLAAIRAPSWVHNVRGSTLRTIPLVGEGDLAEDDYSGTGDDAYDDDDDFDGSDEDEEDDDDGDGLDDDGRPQLSSLIDTESGRVTGDVSWLLDFAIIAHPKCATSAVVRWLSSHPDVKLKLGEDHSLRQGRVDLMVEHLYSMHSGSQYKRGYKAPQDLYTPHSIQALAEYFPSTKLIVGVRHPVKMFESWYNYNSRRVGLTSVHLLPAEQHVGVHFPDRLRFHRHLAYLGKTSPNTPEELELLGEDFVPIKGVSTLPNSVFLYESGQPFDINAERNAEFRGALTSFLGLSTDLEVLPPRNSAGDNYHYAIDICEDRFTDLRAVLIENGRAAAEWIRRYFLDLDDVFVSNKDRFIELMDGWSVDPCIEISNTVEETTRNEDFDDGSVDDMVESESQERNSDENEPKVVATADDWPALSTLVDGDQIIGNVSFLLDFAIIGHSKTSTTSMMDWLYSHPEVQMYDKEIHELQNERTAGFVELMYKLPAGHQYKRGYKAPNDIRRTYVLDNIRKYFPQTKLIVGLRHPVLWFQSFYNFKTIQGKEKPPAESMIGDLLPDQIRYHVHLSLLGKTNPRDPDEANLLGPTFDNYPPIEPLPNKVMLYEISQPFDKTDDRHLAFRKDLSNFIGLDHPLDTDYPDYDSMQVDGFVPIHICEPKYTRLRAELMVNAVNASIWIRKYFLDHPDVVVSSREHFEELLESWLVDPCKYEQNKHEEPVGVAALDIFHREELPPISSLINENREIVSDVSNLIDFAIIAHPKCATSTIMRWMAEHEEIVMHEFELRSLINDDPAELVEQMYELPAGNYKRGFKDPRTGCLANALKIMATYWPTTKLIIGIRHPVKWMESWYNFKARQGYELGPAENRTGLYLPDQVRSHIHLAMMGKTDRESDEEMALLNAMGKEGLEWDDIHPLKGWRDIPKVTNEVFLFEVSQPFDRDDERRDAFREDLSRFVGLNRSLDPIKIRSREGGNFHYVIDICEAQFDDLRAELMNVSVAASRWVREYFLPLPDVYVSSPDRFNEILMTWMTDPCDQ